MHYEDYDRRPATRERRRWVRKLVIHTAVALVAALGGVAGGVEISDDFGTCAEDDD